MQCNHLNLFRVHVPIYFNTFQCSLATVAAKYQRIEIFGNVARNGSLAKKYFHNSSVVKEKSESQDVCYKKIKQAIFQKTFLTPWNARASGRKKCLFFRKFGELCFLVKPVLRFVLLPYYRRIIHLKFTKFLLAGTWSAIALCKR